jgi:hypothetical protein
MGAKWTQLGGFEPILPPKRLRAQLRLDKHESFLNADMLCDKKGIISKGEYRYDVSN